MLTLRYLVISFFILISIGQACNTQTPLDNQSSLIGAMTRSRHAQSTRSTLFPKSHDIRDSFSPDYRRVYYQKQFSACVGNAIASGLWYGQARVFQLPPEELLEPSRLFIYCNARRIDSGRKNTLIDDGTLVESGIEGLKKYMVCSEREFPYLKLNLNTHPEKLFYKSAKKSGSFLPFTYKNIPHSMDTLKKELLKGHPIVFGLQLFDSFYSKMVKRTGLVPMSKKKEKKRENHALLLIGYDDEKHGGSFLVQNSWGKCWGIQGCCYIPYAYVLNKKYADEFWAIRCNALPQGKEQMRENPQEAPMR